MTQIVQQGAINTTALIVPDLYVQIVPPQTLLLNGVPTDILGIVGTAPWGPVNTATIIGNMGDYAQAFGTIVPRTFDMGTHVATAVQQGAQNFRCVRVTDGTDTAATANVLSSSITFTALYTGSVGNGLSVSVGYGSQNGTYKLVVSLAGTTPEVYDNISGAGNELWVVMAAAVNAGNGPLRGPSQLITAAPGTTTSPPAIASYTLSGGSDGASSITTSILLGQDIAPRTGMYALRGQGCGIALLADLYDSASWTAQVALALSEGLYIILVGPPNDNILNAVATKATAGVDSYSAKMMFGDWIYWVDSVNGITRLVSPQGFAAGRLANLSPEQSSLNKQIYGVVSSQKSGGPGGPTQSTYASADLEALIGAGIDVICNPQPGGSYWGVRGGHNTSSNAAINGDNYTRLTTYIAATLAAGMGGYVGQIVNASLFDNIKATLMAFLSGMLTQGLLGSTDGSLPFAVVCNSSNNPVSRTGLGYVQADVQVQYQAINEKFIVNVQGGQTVTVSTGSNAS
jgi:phage tail sheath protein FI